MLALDVLPAFAGFLYNFDNNDDAAAFVAVADDDDVGDCVDEDDGDDGVVYDILFVIFAVVDIDFAPTSIRFFGFLYKIAKFPFCNVFFALNVKKIRNLIDFSLMVFW